MLHCTPFLKAAKDTLPALLKKPLYALKELFLKAVTTFAKSSFWIRPFPIAKKAFKEILA